MQLSTSNKIILNAVLLATIAMVATLMAYQNIPDVKTLYTGILVFIMTLCTQLKFLVTDDVIQAPKLGMILI